MQSLRSALLALVFCSIAAAAGMRITVAQLTDFIRSSVEQKIPDKQVAQSLRTMTLTDRLDARTIEEFQSIGAGPKTLEALRALGAESAKLAPPPPPVEVKTLPTEPGPNSVEQERLIDAARDYALNYSKQLPNFVCLEVIRRYYDPTSTASWRHYDTVSAKVTFFDQKEDYKVIGVSDRPDAADVPLFALGGTMSSGEFGTQLRQIFLPSTQTHFAWERWATLRGRRAYVFAYEVDQARSEYSMKYENLDVIVPGYKGLIYIDRVSGMVVRLTLDPIIPPEYPVQSAHTVLDYDYEKIGDNEYLLPLKAVLTSKTKGMMAQNEIEFRMYHRYGAEATVTFGDEPPPPLPEDKTKEKP